MKELVLKEQYGSNHFVLDSYFMNAWNKQKNIFWKNPYCVLIKICRKIGKCNTDGKTTIISRAIWVKFCYLQFSFLNAFKIENSMSLWWNIIKTLSGQYGSNCIVCIISWLEFARNIAKFNINQTICNVDKDWSKFTKRTIWISPYCPWLKFFKNISSSKKELLMESYM